MKRILIFFTFVILIASTSCRTTRFDPVMEGTELPQPVVEDLLGHSIRVSLMNRSWTPIEDVPGSITARFMKGGGEIAVDIRIDYDDSGWTTTYLQSKNLKYNEKRSKIHRNFVGWIEKLHRGIYVEYMDKIS